MIRTQFDRQHCARFAWLVGVLLCLAADGAVAGPVTPMFTGLGDLTGGAVFSVARGVSGDGSVVVGYSNSASSDQAFRWTSGGGMVGLGDLPGGGFSSAGNGVSGNGSVVVGYGTSASGQEAFRWTSGSGMVGLGDLPGGGFFSEAQGVSGDGSIVVGYSYSSSGDQAFRWTSVGGMVGLGDLPGGSFISRAWGVSDDGSVIVGRGNSASGFEAFRWTSGGGMVGLGDLPGGGFYSEALGVSDDGSVVVGSSSSVSGFEAYRWTSEGGMVGLGDLPGGSFQSFAFDVSGDGSVVVGRGNSASGNQAFRWTNANGMQSVKDILTSQGLGAAVAGWTLREATGVSADGRTIVGWGTNPLGQTEAWIAVVPEPSTLMWAVVGCAVLAACRLRRNALARSRRLGCTDVFQPFVLKRMLMQPFLSCFAGVRGRTQQELRMAFLVKTLKTVACRRAVAVAVGLLGMHVQAALAGTVVDSFDAAHDYLGGNVAGTIWSGVLHPTGLQSGNASISTPGELNWAVNPNVGWEDAFANGPVLYKLVSGDFDVSVRVTALSEAWFSDGGLIARVPTLADAGPGEDYVALRHFLPNGINALRSTDNGSTTNLNFAAPIHPWLRMTRSGSTFQLYTRPGDNDPWIFRTSTVRPDIGAIDTLQVGLWFGTFSSNPGYMRFDEFQLSGPNVVPEPSTWALALFGAIGIPLIVHSRRRRGSYPRRVR